ncbi:hypothetical protein FPRO05_02157 [Fusarium proliferatum]|uniref:Uncharacterized protein n=1 Tax=Gibberella intermedia TaxID=948311 RepID=A0A365N9D8_GIBIN|nr:hypothetical protein FPRO05_02157 [Fusarium proliferatum]
MANHAGPQNIGNPLYTLCVSPINVSPVLLPILNKHKYLPKVVYFWTDDDKEDFELKPVNKTRKPISVHKRSHYQEPPCIPGEYREVSLLQKHPSRPLAVVFQAMKAANPDWTCGHVDIIAQSDLLNHIYSWISGAQTSSFVIDASVVSDTLCITLSKDEKPSSGSQEDESPSPSPTTIGQHQILEYSFGGLNLLVTSPGHLVRFARSNKVCFARILQTGVGSRPDWPNAIPLLWFDGICTCVSGSVSDGVFKQGDQWYVTRKLRYWQSDEQTREHMQTMAWLLNYVRIITSWEMFSGSSSIHFKVSDGTKRLEFYAASRAQKLPTLFGAFWDYS